MSSLINNILGRFSTGSNSLRTLDSTLGGKFTFKNLTYPDDINNIGGGHNHCMVFNVFVRESSKAATNRPRSGQTIGNIFSGGIIGNTVNSARQLLPNAAQNVVNQAAKTVVNNLVGLSESIVLYIPHELMTNDSQNWSMDSFKDVEYLAQAKDLKELAIKGATIAGGNLVKRVLDRLSSSSAEDATAIASKISGRIINPYYELLYQGTQFRDFNFSFKFTPQTAKDAERVRDIIRTFRYHQAPEIDDSTLGGRFLLYPSEFRIQFLSYGKENEFINKIGRCVLTNVQTNYTGSGVAAFHNDGSPISYTLSLTFRELEIVTKEKIGLPGESDSKIGL